MRYRNNYWYVSRKILSQIYTRELMLRDIRTLDYVQRALGTVSLKDVKDACGLSYKQAIESLARLEYFGDIAHRQVSKWNGQHYIYPHEFWAA